MDDKDPKIHVTRLRDVVEAYLAGAVRNQQIAFVKAKHIAEAADLDASAADIGRVLADIEDERAEGDHPIQLKRWNAGSNRSKTWEVRQC